MKHYEVTNYQLAKILAVICPVNFAPRDTETKLYRISIVPEDEKHIKHIVSCPKGAGIVVRGLTASDNVLINKLTLAKEFGDQYCAQYKDGFWFFPERAEFHPALSAQLEEEFTRAGIEAKIETVC